MDDHRLTILDELVRANTPQEVELAQQKLRVLREEEKEQTPEPPC